jgi:hypothetical protein
MRRMQPNVRENLVFGVCGALVLAGMLIAHHFGFGGAALWVVYIAEGVAVAVVFYTAYPIDKAIRDESDDARAQIKEEEIAKAQRRED